MFNTLASYLLGSFNEEQTNRVEDATVRLTSVVAEDDWVLVDRDEEGNRDSEGNSDTDSCSEENWDDVYSNLTNRGQLSHRTTRSNSLTSLPCASLEESWFVTPPPCFTCTEPVHMETSPLENLLIEHPSMSVYQHTHPALMVQKYNPIPVDPVLHIHEFVVENRILAEEIQRLEVEAYSEKPLANSKRNRVDVLRQQEQQWFKTTKAQKVYIEKASRSLKNKYLERSNKAREVNNRNQHQQRSKRSRGAMSSYANNNRKC